MSKTDKTRPWWVNEKDPFNRRFLRVTGEQRWWWKRITSNRGCWCCSQKKRWKREQDADRMRWQTRRRKLEKGGWQVDQG